ncbi:YoaK family protein [Streptacidiphilus melanogenes]|uniref:YoaK family protein n=1 Tax=Streptacidiphilus melanogenes TaxID=411235 RepID=UPI000694FA2C|nr:YoaK family protein [Streptacidiphilus melanogenes]
MVTIHRRTDNLPVGALLASVGGFLDAFTLVLYQVFANLQSGNVVLFWLQVSSWHWRAAALRLVPIAAFVLGVLVVDLLGTPRLMRVVRRPLRLVVTAEIVLLAAMAALPDDTPVGVTTITVAFVAALQFSTFTTLHDAPYATVMTSGNLRQWIVATRRWLVDRDATARQRSQQYGIIVGSFTLGAMVGVICTRWLGRPAIAVAAGLLVVVLALLIRETRRLERRAAASAPA